jgi:hypothetical protein
MKIICAGAQKTGSKSLSEALSLLGYKVYDAPETYTYMRKTWIKFFNGKITIEQVCQKYDQQDCDVVIDLPTNYFWREMAEYWPQAKIILTVRDDEEKWYASLVRFFKGNVAWIGKFIYVGHLSPLAASTEYGMTIPYLRLMYGNANLHPFKYDFDNVNNALIYKRKYREHNLMVRNFAPPGRLLDYNVKEGWSTLCKFLDVPLPDRDFPFRNQSGSPEQTAKFVQELMATHIRKCKIEIGISITLILLLSFALSCSIYYLT